MVHKLHQKNCINTLKFENVTKNSGGGEINNFVNQLYDFHDYNLGNFSEHHTLVRKSYRECTGMIYLLVTC